MSSPSSLTSAFNSKKIAGQSLLAKGDKEAALMQFQQMTSLMPENPVGHMLIASVYAATGEVEKALPSLRKASSLAPGDISLLKLLASTLRKRSLYDEAAQAFSRILVSEPGNMEVLGSLIETHAQAGNHQAALDALSRAFVLTSNELPLLQAYLTLGERLQDKAAIALAKARLSMLQENSKLTSQAQGQLSVVNVEITTYCNLKCPGCCRTVGVNGGTWKNQHLSLDNYSRIVDGLPPTALFIPYGIGEPMLHPQIFEIIRIAKASGKFKRLMITSNALSRKIEDFHRLFELGLDTLCISVDSFDPILIEKTRAGTDVEELKLRIQNLVTKYPGHIETRTVVSNINIGTIRDILHELNSMGRMTCYLQAYDDVGNPSGCLPASTMANFEKELLAMAGTYPNLKIVPQSFVPSTGLCRMPWNAPFITVNGDVTPCCRVVNADTASFGNTLSTPFPELWNSESTRQWRSAFLKASHPMCKGCPMFVYRE